MKNITHKLVPRCFESGVEDLSGIWYCRYCEKTSKELPAQARDVICREAVLQSGARLLPASEWEKIKGIKIHNADGWGDGLEGWPPASWDDMIPEEEFDLRAVESTVDMRII